MTVYIDTEIWIFAQKVPDAEFFKIEAEYLKALKLHQQSSTFLKKEIVKSEVSMTYHQLCEIFHALAYRGKKSTKEFASKYSNQLLSSSFMQWYQVLKNHVIQAIKYSLRNGIHIWDYICVLPLYNDVDILYSCDEHFNHESFRSLGPKVENPLDVWITI